MKYKILKGTIEVVSGLHIGGGDAGMQIGGIDRPIIKQSHDGLPYIPGSSLKGRMRALLETYHGFNVIGDGKVLSPDILKKLGNDQKEQLETGKNIIKMFGSSGDTRIESDSDGFTTDDIGTARLSFWDCPIDKKWVKKIEDEGLSLTEEKFENTVNRLTGAANNPRPTERVPVGAKFKMKITLRLFDGDDEKKIEELLSSGLEMIEWEGLGGSVTRGYGRVKFDKQDTEVLDFTKGQEKETPR